MKLLKGSSSHHKSSSSSDKKKKSKSKSSSSKSKSRSSKASKELINQDQVNSEITYLNDSFSSVASSVTSPPSMTQSFYTKALNGWDLDDEEPQQQQPHHQHHQPSQFDASYSTSNSNSIVISDGEDDDKDDEDAGHWAGVGMGHDSFHGSSDSGSIDVSLDDDVNSTDAAGSLASEKKHKKKKTGRHKFRLRGKKKKMMKEQETIQESLYEDTQHTMKSGTSVSTGSEYCSSNDDVDIYGYGDYGNNVDDNDEFGGEDPASAPTTRPPSGPPKDVSPNKAFRKKGRRASMGDVVSYQQPTAAVASSVEAEGHNKHHNHNRRRRNSLLGNVLGGGGGSKSDHHQLQNNSTVPQEEQQQHHRKQGRRNSLFGSSTSENHHQHQHAVKQQDHPQHEHQHSAKQQKEGEEGHIKHHGRRQRRHSMFGSSAAAKSAVDENASEHSPKQQQQPEKEQQPKQRRRRRNSIFGSSNTDGAESVTSSSVAAVKIPKDIHRVVNQERIMRNMQPFTRNMLLDTLSKSIANDMMTGRPSGGCDYHGNVGQGLTLQQIHNTLMDNTQGNNSNARKNILSNKFTEFGMAVVMGYDNEQTLYMCQLFK